MTYLIEYELDQFQPWRKMAVYVYGKAQISYNWEGRDRDTGYRGGPCDIELQNLVINSHAHGDPDYIIESTDPLFIAIENAIATDDHVIQSCIDDYES